jgi:hypothetical protein
MIRACGILTATALTVIRASRLGRPVSTTQVTVAAVLGVRFLPRVYVPAPSARSPRRPSAKSLQKPYAGRDLDRQAEAMAAA